MKLVRIGNLIINMEQVIAIQDEETELELMFGGSSEYDFSIRLEGKAYSQMKSWLGRNGVNELSNESPKLRYKYFDWE